MISRFSQYIPSILSKMKRAQISQRCFSRVKLDINKVPPLKEFLKQQTPILQETVTEDFVDYMKNSNLVKEELERPPKNFFIETYGCQMNENDTEIVSSILQNAGFVNTKEISNAQIIFLNTCAIRENAETKVWNKLTELRAMKNKVKKNQMIIGVLGCMAERLKEKLVEKNKSVDIVVGPDAYRDLPRLIQAVEADSSSYGINVQLSYEETYADIVPVRSNPDSQSAFVSIMRGCNNMCSFCIVPFTRGRERSRDIDSILDEVKGLRDRGIKEITLLGQNVNSYHDNLDHSVSLEHENSTGFNEMYKLRQGSGARFDILLQRCAEAAPEVRFRFTSPHPKDFPERVLEVVKSYDNICKNIHLPAQSGSSNMLKKMRRNHTREVYLDLVDRIKATIPEVTLSTDLICGFCGETEEEFQDTLSLLDLVKYEQAFLFAYSMREKTHAHRNYTDDVLPEIKQKRLERMIDTFLKNQLIATQREHSRYHILLAEGPTNKAPGQWKGRTDTNRTAVFNIGKGIVEKIPQKIQESIRNKVINRVQLDEEISKIRDHTNVQQVTKGDYIVVRVDNFTNKTLFCTPIAKTNISDFSYISKKSPYFNLE